MWDWHPRYKSLFVKRLIVLGITIITLLSSLDMLMGCYTLSFLRIVAILGFWYTYRVMRKDLNKGINIGIAVYSAFQAVYTVFYYHLPETGTWLVVYALILALLTPPSFAAFCSFVMYTIYAVMHLTHAQSTSTFMLTSSLLQTGAAIFMAIIISTYYKKQINHSAKKLVKTAQQDSLTGLFTRRAMTSFINQQINRFQKENCCIFSAILIDLDNFKEINDTKGHIYGDRMLQKIGSIIRSNIRKKDLPVRYGGDEFVILLPETDIQGALKVAEKLAKAIKEATGITSSIGVFSYSGEGDLESFLSKLDEACYSAKKKGKDRIEIAHISAQSPA